MTRKDEEENALESGSGLRPVRSNASGSGSGRYGEGDLIAGRYRLGKMLGEGGMGEVWLAHNDTLDIDVAIKLIRAGNRTGADNRSGATDADRLLTEARAAARLGHPAIVRINDFGTTERGDPFIVMELLEGETLGTALQSRGRLSAIKAVRTILPIAHALTVAHNKGIVHRDLKPENIFLAQTDDAHLQPKLLDFGVAKLEAQHGRGGPTPTGTLFGSPLYMAPEQARGDDVDHRADIWALSVVLYELICGRPPFEGKNYNAVLYSIVANPATPIMDLGAGDEDLWVVLERALRKDPDRRWYSMRDFGEALATWLEDRDIHEDISGTSLQTTWLQWRRDGGDQLESAPPQGLAVDDLPSAFPPPPNLPQLERSRVNTVRKRPASISTAAYVGLALALGLLVYVLVRVLSPNEIVVKNVPVPSAAATVEPVGGEPASEFSVRTKSELVAEPAVAASSLPVAVEDEAVNEKKAQRSPPASRPAARPSGAPRRTPEPRRRGFVESDPYREGLKDPFQ